MKRVFVNDVVNLNEVPDGSFMIRRNNYKEIKEFRLMSVKEKGILFVKNNLFLVFLGGTSVCVILLYLITYTIPELFVGAERIFNLIFQISIACIANIIFYYFQIFVPQMI